MAQTIKLKRTAVQGKIPTTSNIELGELAMNTYDGRIFFEKNNGTPSVQEIITTDAEVTGSLNLNGALSASSLNITGNTTIGGDLTLEGQLTIGDATTDSVNVIASLSSSLIPNDNLSFDLGSSSKKWSTAYIGTSNVDVQNIIDTRSGQNYSLTIGANSTGDRFHVATDNTTNAGIVLSSRNSTNTSNQKLSFSGSAFEFGGGTLNGDGSGLTGIQVDQVVTVTSSFDNQSTINVSHNFDSYNVIVSTYDTSYNQLIPQTVSLTDTNTVQVVLSANHSGHVVVAKGGHVVSGSTSADNISGLSDKIQELTSYREDVSGASFYSITHNLNESYPFVQAWNTSNNTMELPIDVESTSINAITISFSANFAGKIIVKK
jgi:hypothetical protein